jgi:hypothetical protein
MLRLASFVKFTSFLLMVAFMPFSWAMDAPAPASHTPLADARFVCNNQQYVKHIADLNEGKAKYTQGYVHGNVACQLAEYDRA